MYTKNFFCSSTGVTFGFSEGCGAVFVCGVGGLEAALTLFIAAVCAVVQMPQELDETYLPTLHVASVRVLVLSLFVVLWYSDVSRVCLG